MPTAAKLSSTKPESAPDVSFDQHPDSAVVLSAPAVAFVADPQRLFGAERAALLAARVERQNRFDAGEKPNFLAETEEVRQGGWLVPQAPKPLSDRRVEITGPVEAKMMINAVNAGAKVFMADLEDANSPTWTTSFPARRT